MDKTKKDVIDACIKDVYERLDLDRDKTFFVNTIVEVVDIDNRIREGDKWIVGSLTARDFDCNEDSNVNIRINLWGTFSFLVNDIEKGDVLIIKSGLAKNYSYSDKVYPQINCDERYGSEIIIRYKKEKIIVDGSNVAWTSKKDGRPNIDNIEMVRLELERRGYAPIIIVDSNLRHLIPEADKERFERWVDDERVIQAPAQIKADDVLLKFADERGVKIVSNDTFKEYVDIYPWLEDASRRVPFNIIGSEVILYTDYSNLAS
ncbi:MAG TPA: hypothetical protein HA341_05600 [Halobacteria archaeon]|nr:hypothetical protein [Halobacteria archaeon]HIH78380.1 hypothetical protein [Halobacteria archaeon]